MKTRLVQFFTGVLTAGVLAFNPVQAGCHDNSCSRPQSCESDCCDFDGSVHAELLIWDTCNCMDFYSVDRHATFADYDWDVGFRVGGSWAATADWDLDVEFTYFSSDASDSHNSASTPTSGLEMGGQTYDASTAASFKADLDYYTLDVLIAKKCCACDKFVIRPFGGFRALWTEQGIHESGIVATAATSTNASYDVDGYGLHSGLEFEWCAFGPLTFVGKFGGSLLVGEKDFHQVRKDAAGAAVAGTDYARKTDLSCPFGYETSIGLDYQDELCDSVFGLRATYEMVHWNNVGNPYDFNSDLGFHGFSLQARFEF